MRLAQCRAFYPGPAQSFPALAGLARQPDGRLHRSRLRPPTHWRQRATEYSKNLADCGGKSIQQRIKPGFVRPRDEKRKRGPEVDPGTDIFCNNKILEEMAEAWKNEMSLG